MKVYMKREHEIFVEWNKGIREEWIVIWNGNYLGKTPMGVPKKFRIYEHMDILPPLEPRDADPAKEQRKTQVSQVSIKQVLI